MRVEGASKNQPGVKQGYVDFVHTKTGEAYEVKAIRSLEDGIKDIAGYLEYLKTEAPPPMQANSWTPGKSYAKPSKPIGLWPIGPDPSYDPARDGYYIIVASLAAPGVVTYESMPIPNEKVRDYAYEPVAVDEFAKKWLYDPKERDPLWRYRDKWKGKKKFPDAIPLPYSVSLPETVFLPDININDVLDNFDPRPTVYVCVGIGMMVVMGGGGINQRNFLR